MKNSIWIIGPGYMGMEYYKILADSNFDITVIGRSKKSNWPCDVYPLGLDNFIKNKKHKIPDYAIVCVNEHKLSENVKILVDSGVKNVLVEKPGAIDIKQLENLYELSKKAHVHIGYNRRFYQSVQKCKELINQADGPISVNFEFTEWTHKLDFNHYTEKELSRFFLCNSSHVADTVFYLVGKPKEINCKTGGTLEWHPSAALFSGSGITEENVLFNYNANWLSAGRWSIEINLPDKKLILRPLEELFIQKRGHSELEQFSLDNIDIKYKPGLYNQVKSFLGDKKFLCTVKEQLDNFNFYYRMANYE